MSRLPITLCSFAGKAALVVPFLCLLLLFGCGGKSGVSNNIVSGGGGQNPPPPPLPAGAESFGMQCALFQGNCPNYTWPATQAQPGCFRLHDAGTFWSLLNPSSGVYDWTNLDNWLDVIEQHEPRCVIQTFVWVPCWDAPACNAPPVAQPNGTNAPPNDLTPSGSPSFNSFVTAFVQHCSPAGNCVKNIIKYYEMWNEWNTNLRWSGTPQQLYQMVAPAVSIIRQNVPNAVILTPAIAGRGDPGALATWLSLELSSNNGKPLSDWVAWHDYTQQVTPEVEFSAGGDAMNLVNAQTSVAGWGSIPWADTETNFDTNTYACDLSMYSADDCTGQIIRWQLLHQSNGAASVIWYRWMATIGSIPQYETAYYYMMQYMVGGKFGGPCAPVSGVAVETWTCNFTEPDGKTAALFAWTPNEAGTTFQVPSGFIDYKDFSGNKTTVASGQTINITVIPVMLEQ